MIGSTHFPQWHVDPEPRPIVRASLPGALDTRVAVPSAPTLHDINQTYLDAYCQLMDQRSFALGLDEWDMGVTTSGTRDVVAAVSLPDLQYLRSPKRAQVLGLLLDWRSALRETLRALKQTDGCSGFFGRHANSREIESHLASLVRDWRGAKADPFLEAAALANLPALRECIIAGVDINAEDRRGRTALFVLLQNRAEDCDTRKKIDACAALLLSFPGVDVHRRAQPGYGARSRNVFCLAIQNGHQSIARHLLRQYPNLEFDGGPGETAINSAARYCPGLLMDLGNLLVVKGIEMLALLYKAEVESVAPEHVAWSNRFFGDVLNAIVRNDPVEGRRAMWGLLIAALEMSDEDMVRIVIEAAARENARTDVAEDPVTGLLSRAATERLRTPLTLHSGDSA